ncbi:uncharacterized protein LOC111716481 isoform X6 [Eurytemora carolleeae]|uniref:uncharacterized protein LOC111716481 isoform X6 n=1 Tax=Eurytemora carolleeae TaxID=1294199 RepID=UPI000C76B418|nr:uncharacterized protein LOC111716481 isoform X6 [Eurytemora carolleeae]|eukprot:XP_023347710.1 uncharacterized protein LOC111716481 isoform X6 [Eurytemora affinis]
MFFSKVFLIVSSVILATQSFPQIKLQSLLPVDPIEEFDTWAWGEHPNGLGYKARNGLSVDQCLKNPHLIDTPACKFPAKLCMDVPEYATKQACADALYPKEFCVANPVLVSAKGCQKYLADICSLDVKLALSPPCADVLYPKKFCMSSPVLVSEKRCHKILLCLSDICSLDVKLATSPPCTVYTVQGQIKSLPKIYNIYFYNGLAIYRSTLISSFKIHKQ